MTDDRRPHPGLRSICPARRPTMAKKPKPKSKPADKSKGFMPFMGKAKGGKSAAKKEKC